MRRLVLPFDAYTLNEADIATVSAAEDLATARCMREQGLSWRVEPPVTASHWPNRRRYGVVEMRVARAYGYHPPPDPAEEQRRSAKPPSLPSKQRKAAYGTDGHGGCVGWARSALLRGVPHANLTLLDRLDGQIWDATQHDPRVTAAFGRWSACMRRHGHDFADPISINNDRRWHSDQPSAGERATAVTDVSCKQETGLVRTWFGVEVRSQRRAIADHRRDFATLNLAKHRMILNAHKIIGP